MGTAQSNLPAAFKHPWPYLCTLVASLDIDVKLPASLPHLWPPASNRKEIIILKAKTFNDYDAAI